MDDFCVQLAEFNEKRKVDHLKRIGVEPGVVATAMGRKGTARQCT